MFSKACEYGIKAVIFIAIKSYEDLRVSPKEIAEKIDSPQAFTAKILQSLVHHDIVNSIKGAHGGFEIQKDRISQIKLAEIVKAIDGDSIYMGCGLGLEKCDENHPCPAHDKFKIVRDELQNMLENTTLEELALNIKSGTSFLRV
ncbi:MULTISPECIES: Rrf2 family transcriptional regulator [unclassified Algibacter]|uniref:RrF2 family transcriptional regulator n=1 Tax=unclassified Algibacter TaxID=2615009 RepID=UPI00131C658D|nr:MULTISPECIES: Rrf2 family transcriptional regulator [unclassified Algibacter]MCL5127519.1 Rrf2 family transcriptional regulator [Algibacter sp. L4_22]